jgi:hypothetical protein
MAVDGNLVLLSDGKVLCCPLLRQTKSTVERLKAGPNETTKSNPGEQVWWAGALSLWAASTNASPSVL